MNEQLIVKNFGPIKDATVDFKRVTVFIGPTGGGKSTLAKLAMMFRSGAMVIQEDTWNTDEFYSKYKLESFSSIASRLSWNRNGQNIVNVGGDKKQPMDVNFTITDGAKINNERISVSDFIYKLREPSMDFIKKIYPALSDAEAIEFRTALTSLSKEVILETIVESTKSSEINYFPAERIFLSAVEYSWAGFMRDDIGLPKMLLDFANNFSVSRKNISELSIDFLNVKYIHIDGRDFIKIPNHNELIILSETASGIQSVTPLLVLLEYLSRNTEQAQSFIIEEPEINLYPTAQQGLLNWLVEKCTKGENDLTITTHSPYILSHLNLLLYAYQVAEQHPERADEVAELVPRESWINPREFACYQVENGGVTSLVNEDLGLIDDNGLDGLSGDAADAFDNLIRLSKGVALK